MLPHRAHVYQALTEPGQRQTDVTTNQRVYSTSLIMTTYHRRSPVLQTSRCFADHRAIQHIQAKRPAMTTVHQ